MGRGSSYLGERRDEGACSRIFKRDEAEVRVRVEDLDGLSWDAAVALQESGLGPTERVSSEAIVGDLKAHWTRGAKETWLLVPGWSRPRRIAWPTDACPDEAIARVAGSMASAPERAPVRPVAGVARLAPQRRRRVVLRVPGSGTSVPRVALRIVRLMSSTAS